MPLTYRCKTVDWLITQKKVKSFWVMEMLLLCKFLISLMELGVFFFEWLFKSLPLDDQLLKAATFINFEQRANADPLHAEFLVSLVT